MRKILSKRICCLIAAMCLFFLGSGAISAAQIPMLVTRQTTLEDLIQYDTDGDGLVAAIVVGSEPTGNTSNSGGIQPLSVVTDNGVCLRSAPSTSATVLELMYQGETVYIDYAASAKYSDWYFVMRDKTKTWGYASKLYIY